MRVDVSEIKTFKECKRKWQLSSRNQFHLRPYVTPKAFALGTLFHESLHSLYLGAPLEKVMEMVKREMDPDDDVALLAMIPGYADKVLPEDLDTYKVLDIEHKFAFKPFDVETGEIYDNDLTICGSIDMIALNRIDNKIYGFEHKTAKKFRDYTFLWMDDQPRVYTLALQQYVDNYNRVQYEKWIMAGSIGEEPRPAAMGGIYINEVKKLLRQFDYQRTLLIYEPDELMNYARAFFGTCHDCALYVNAGTPAAPSPSYMGCQMCDFATICGEYQYRNLDKQEILEEFSFEFVERDHDHLDEKVERIAD